MKKPAALLVRVLVLLCCLFALPAWPSTITVTSNADSGLNTLRNAIANANAGDTIQFMLPGGKITLASTLILTKNVTIDGSGNTGLTISGNHAVEVFVVNAGVTATIASLTIADGTGGIDNEGTLIVAVCTLTGNSSYNGGGILNEGMLTLTNSTLSGSGAANNGGGIWNGGSATITNNTFVNNAAFGYGGGIFSVSSSASTVTNNLFVGNTATQYGGSVGDLANVINADHNLYWNNADTSGGQGINCNNCASNTSAVNADPVLGSLQYNGGPTPTYLPGVGSAAINAAASSGCPATDQRGVARPQPAAGACDIGSVEVAAPTYAPVATTGYSRDSIAEAVPALSTTNYVLDNSDYVLYSAAYGNDPSINTGLGLPDSGHIVSGSRTYQLLPYTDVNVLLVDPATARTLALTTPQRYTSISLLGFSTEGNTSAQFQLNFSDSSNALFSGLTVLDWFDGGGTVILNGFDRTGRTSDTPDDNNTGPNLYATDIALACADQAKLLHSIDVINPSAAGPGPYLITVAVSAVPTLEPIAGSGIISTVGGTTTLSDATPGGIWSSDTTNVATVNSASGVVTSVAKGAATITYTLTLSPCSAVVTQSKLVLVADEIFMSGFE